MKKNGREEIKSKNIYWFFADISNKNTLDNAPESILIGGTVLLLQSSPKLSSVNCVSSKSNEFLGIKRHCNDHLSNKNWILRLELRSWYAVINLQDG